MLTPIVELDGVGLLVTVFYIEGVRPRIVRHVALLPPADEMAVTAALHGDLNESDAASLSTLV